MGIPQVYLSGCIYQGGYPSGCTSQGVYHGGYPSGVPLRVYNSGVLLRVYLSRCITVVYTSPSLPGSWEALLALFSPFHGPGRPLLSIKQAKTPLREVSQEHKTGYNPPWEALSSV